MSTFTAYEIQTAICKHLVSAEVALVISQRCGATVNAFRPDEDDTSTDTATLLLTYPDESFLLATITEEEGEFIWAIGAFRTRELVSDFLRHGAKEDDTGLYASIPDYIKAEVAAVVERPLLDALKEGHFNA
jgi:hypothetical protein